MARMPIHKPVIIELDYNAANNNNNYYYFSQLKKNGKEKKKKTQCKFQCKDLSFILNKHKSSFRIYGAWPSNCCSDSRSRWWRWVLT